MALPDDTELIAKALAHEFKAFAFYRKSARMTRNSNSHAIFTALEAEERQHIATLLRQGWVEQGLPSPTTRTLARPQVPSFAPTQYNIPFTTTTLGSVI